MKKITEVRELSDDENIEDIIYFEYKPDAEKYIKECKNKCILKQYPIVLKGKSIENFKKERLKEQALSKLTNEEKEILGLI